MAANRTFLVFLVSTSLLVSCLSLPASKDKDTVGDVHLNGVLPESDTPSQPLKVREQQAASAEHSLELELQPEAEATTMRGPPTEKIPETHGNPPYFSRVIQSIFEIPIAVLTAVRNLLQTTAVPKYPSP